MSMDELYEKRMLAESVYYEPQGSPWEFPTKEKERVSTRDAR